MNSDLDVFRGGIVHRSSPNPANVAYCVRLSGSWLVDAWISWLTGLLQGMAWNMDDHVLALGTIAGQKPESLQTWPDSEHRLVLVLETGGQEPGTDRSLHSNSGRAMVLPGGVIFISGPQFSSRWSDPESHAIFCCIKLCRLVLASKKRSVANASKAPRLAESQLEVMIHDESLSDKQRTKNAGCSIWAKRMLRTCTLAGSQTSKKTLVRE
jgi:hypothetical protein